MGQTNEDILARSFFDLAKKVEDIAGSDVAQTVETFGNDDYASIVSGLLDAAYWILAGQLETTLESDPIGHDLYVSSSVYNDLLYRGYSPGWAWEESGLMDLFGDPPDGKRAEPVKDRSGLPSVTASSEFKPGEYVVVQKAGGIRGGMMVSSDRMFCFDGAYEVVAGQAQGISEETAQDMLERFADRITTDQGHRVEQRAGNQGQE
jgi:hypothetical protein